LIHATEFQQALSVCSAGVQAAWSGLRGLATPGEVEPELREYLDRFRNQAAFHYDRSQLSNGYAHHFRESVRNVFNERAFMSLGRNMEGTRFYFADTTAGSAYQLFDLSGDKMVRVNARVSSMNLAIRNIIETYVKQREQAAQSGR
jgi:hypothetical protein